MTKQAWRLSLILLLTFSVALVLSLSLMIVSADFGSDWRARFYNCDDLDCSVVEDITYSDGLNFDWDGKPEDEDGDELSDVDEDDFSVLFTTQEDFDADEYEFEITATDGVRLFIDGDEVLDEFDDNSLTTYTFTVELSDGEHDLSVEYFNGSGDAILQVQWFASDGSSSSSSFTSTPAPTSTPNFVNSSVVRVNGLSLRTGPFLGASLIGVLRPGNTYRAVAENNAEGLFTWYFVITDSGYEGWASGRYLELADDTFSLPEIGTDFDGIKGLPDTGVVAVPRAVMNVRVHPSTRTGRITQLPWGGEAQLIARTIQGGKDFWYLVRFDSITGWIYAPFVGVRGDILNVPIY